MFSEYVAKAMQLAEYEPIEDGTFFASIPGFEGVYGNAKTIEACREDLIGSLETWLVAKIWDNDDDIPVIGKLDFKPRKVRLRATRVTKPARSAATPATRDRKAS